MTPQAAPVWPLAAVALTAMVGVYLGIKLSSLLLLPSEVTPLGIISTTRYHALAMQPPSLASSTSVADVIDAGVHVVILSRRRVWANGHMLRCCARVVRRGRARIKVAGPLRPPLRSFSAQYLLSASLPRARSPSLAQLAPTDSHAMSPRRSSLVQRRVCSCMLAGVSSVAARAAPTSP
jgi:hypothetical protein